MNDFVILVNWYEGDSSTRPQAGLLRMTYRRNGVPDALKVYISGGDFSTRALCALGRNDTLNVLLFRITFEKIFAGGEILRLRLRLRSE